MVTEVKLVQRREALCCDKSSHVVVKPLEFGMGEEWKSLELRARKASWGCSYGSLKENTERDMNNGSSTHKSQRGTGT